MDFYRYVSDEERTIEAAWQLKLRDPLLKGHTPLRNIPALLPTCSRVYLSSVFTDSECERQYFIDNVYIKLKEYCRSAHGIELQVVDLRSGLERQSQHVLPSINDVRRFEIKQCQSTSSGPCFVALIGQRYCNEAIPPMSIGKEEFEARKEALLNNNHDISLLEKHYKLDTNQQPSQYLIHPILFEGTDKWVEIERRISELLCQSSDYLSDSDWSNPPSDLQEEMHAGLFSLGKQKFRDDNCLILKKTITDIENRVERKRASKFIDIYPGTNTIDKEARSAHVELLSTAQSYVTPNNVFSFDLKWSEPAGISSVAHRDYLIQLGNTFYEQVRRHVDICMIEWGHYPDDDLYIEVQQHWLCARSNLTHFYEQGQYIQAINNYISSQSHTPLIVYGVSGCGKSALLSNIASSVCEKSSSLRVILRHLGNTPASCDIEQLLHSLIKQLCEVIGMSYSQPKTFLEAKVQFKSIMESGYCNCTLLLVIDGLDRLAPCGYDQIDWLPLKLSPNIKMIVSMRDSEPQNTLSKVRSRYTDTSTFLKVRHMLPEICEWILENRLRDSSHSVTDDQWKVVCKGLNETPYPLYIELVLQQMLRWRSFTYPYLPDNIPAVIDCLLDDLESGHGHLVISHILCIITCSKYGLSEAEIEDILSIDDELLALFSTQLSRQLSVQRVPCLVWSRLKLDLQPYLSVWKVDNINLVTWRYTQLAEAISRRYLSDEAFSHKIHGLIAEYFTGKWSGINKKPNQLTARQEKTITSVIEDVNGLSSSHRNVLTQPLIISGHGTNARINLRKLNELAHHLAKSNRIAELNDTVLFNYSWMHTKLSVMSMARLLSDYDLYTDNEVLLVRQALDDIKTEFTPDILGVELTGRLLPYYSEHPNIRKLIDLCDLEAMRRCSTVPKLQLYQTPGAFLQHQFEQPIEVNSYLQLETVSKPDASYLLTKHRNRTSSILLDVSSYENTRLNGLPDEGDINITPNQERIIAKRGGNIESYQIDSHQLEFTVATDVGPISCQALSDAYFIFSIRQRTGPFVVDLKYPSLVHTFKHHSTAIDISDDSEMMVCNDGHSLQVYELPLMIRHCVIQTDDRACKIAFTGDHNQFCVLSSSHCVRMYTVTRRTRVASCKTLLQEPTIQNILFSPSDKSLLLIHSKKYIKVYKGGNSHTGEDNFRLQCNISDLSHSQSSHDFVSAVFNHDGSKVIAARERSIGVFDSHSGATIRQEEVPFPCDIRSCFSCPNVNRAVTVLENGLVQVWNMQFDTSDKKHMNNYYPGEVTSFSVSHDGSKMVVCNSTYPDAKVIECDYGAVEHRLYDSFAAGSQPLSVAISPCGKFVVTRCSNDAEGTINWPVLKSDYIWSASSNRVTHFFVNSYSVTFSSDDEVVVSLSCIGFSPADPSNKFFVALCYKTMGKEASEHKLTLPDGDVIGQPVVYSDKKWLVCLIQPCIKTKFAGMVMEQRVDDVQGKTPPDFHEFYIVKPDNIILYIFDLFTSSARDRRSINCYDIIPEEKTYFINMRETNTEYHLLLMYSRGKLPPYKADSTVDMGHALSKGMILYDLLNSTILHHVSDYLTPSVPADSLLVTKYLTYILHDMVVYNAKTGVKVRSLGLSDYDHSDTIRPVLLLDGNYIAIVTDDDSIVRIVNSRNSAERSHFLLHGTGVDMKVGSDDRTLYISTKDGRVVVVTVILELCDPVTMLVNHMPSRNRQALK